MGMVGTGMLLALVLLQGPGEAWNVAPGPARDVNRAYWDLFETTEVWVLLVPDGPKSVLQPVNLVFQGFFTGRAEREPSSGLPKWPEGEPERLAVRAQAFPLTVVRELSLKLVVDGELFDLGAACESPGGSGPPACQPLFAGEGAAVGLSVELEPALLQRLVKAGVVTGTALGLPIRLSSDDVDAIRRFAEAAHLKIAPGSEDAAEQRVEPASSRSRSTGRAPGAYRSSCDETRFPIADSR